MFLVTVLASLQKLFRETDEIGPEGNYLAIQTIIVPKPSFILLQVWRRPVKRYIICAWCEL